MSNMVFSSLKGLPVQEQIVWLSISRTRIRVFATLLTNLLPVLLVQNILYGHLRSSLGGFSLGYPEVVVTDSRKRVPW